MKSIIFVALLAGVTLGIAQKRSETANEYVGDGTCRRCHPSVFETYAKVSMSRSFQPISAATEIEDWTSKNRIYHKPSNQYFLMTRKDGRYFQRRYQLDAGARQVNSLEVEIQFAIGSGKHERDYVRRSKSGELLQLPVVWYADENSWGMAPGYDRPDHDGFSRRVNYRCVFCHASYPSLPSGADRSESQVSLFPEVMPSGIGCERCHGPGQRHATDHTASSIVNPARLDRSLQMDVCMQCHLETTSAPLPNSVLKLGRNIFSFKPGEALQDYAAYFDYPAGSGHDDDFNIVHQAYRLKKSQCYAKSSMTCLTCHDPHRVPDDPQTFYNEKCATCHQPDACTLDRESRAESNDNCIACHMPKRPTDDIVHVVMTDHDIQRRPPKDLMKPKTESIREEYRGPLSFYLPAADESLYLGMALARGADVRRGAQLLEQAIDRTTVRSAEPFFALGAAYVSLGQKERAVASYTRGLEIDPAHAEARFNMALALMDTGRYKDAEEVLQEVIRWKPQLTEAYIALGTVETKLGNLNLARSRYLQAVTVDSQNTLALDNLGLLEFQMGRPDQARSYFEQVLRIKPDDPTARTALQKE